MRAVPARPHRDTLDELAMRELRASGGRFDPAVTAIHERLRRDRRLLWDITHQAIVAAVIRRATVNRARIEIVPPATEERL